MTAATMNSSRTGPAATRDRVQREPCQGQHDELDPARDDDGARAGRVHALGRLPLARRGGVRQEVVVVLGFAHAARAPEYGGCPTALRPSSSSATSSAAWAGAPSSPCSRRCASATRPTFVVVNGENVAGGLGITPKIADELLGAGVDAITLGNHAYHRTRDLPVPRRASSASSARPTTCARSPAAATRVVERDGVRLGVVNLSGNLFLQAGAPRVRRGRRRARPAATARPTTCSSTSTPRPRARRSAMGWHLDGRVTAVVGTHTHVPTADARVLPGGTAYITDVGMTGPARRRDRRQEGAGRRVARTHMSVRFETVRRGPVAQRRRDPRLPAAARRRDRAGAHAVDAEQREPSARPKNHTM